MLVVEGVSKMFGTTRAVDKVNLSIPKGQFVGVIGRSGAGMLAIASADRRPVFASQVLYYIESNTRSATIIGRRH